MITILTVAVFLGVQPGREGLATAHAMVDQLRFVEAIAHLETELATARLSTPIRVELLELLAYCQLAERDRSGAERSWETLLEASPAFEPSSSAPKVLEVFRAVKSRKFPAEFIKLEELPSPPTEVALRLVDPWRQIAEVALVMRRDGGAWLESKLQLQDGRFVAPLTVVSDSQLEWYVQARTASGEVRASVASATQPRALGAVNTVRLPPPVPRMNGRRVGGFVALGAGLVLAAAGTALAVSGWNQRLAARDASSPPGDAIETASAAEQDGVVQQRWGAGLLAGAGVAGVTGAVLSW